MAFSHCLLSWSRDTPKMVKFLLLNVFHAATTFGFSSLHGLHQLAQKSTRTYFHFSDERESGFPLVSGRLKSAAILEGVFDFIFAITGSAGNFCASWSTIDFISAFENPPSPNCWKNC